jgi:acyl-coenzyme A synthetase/AMP-(fatty) acid ligase
MLCGIPRHFLSIPEGKFNFKYALLAGEQTPYSINQLLVSHNITPIDAIGTTETLGFYLTKYMYGIRYDDFVTVPGCELVLIPTEGDYEVKIRSEHSAIGYINNKFIDGFYHTGDLVSLHAGQMQFKGRRGDRVKINGLHYYLNDIDNQIKQCDGVIDCACTITQNKLGINKLTVNAIVADRQHIKNIKSLMSRKQIPYYINLVSSLPKTASGKVKRHAITSAC